MSWKPTRYRETVDAVFAAIDAARVSVRSRKGIIRREITVVIPITEKGGIDVDLLRLRTEDK